ncbi:MAG TPA: hypothetical protein VFA17_06915 [Thermoplasmata archaeon]|jgi:hypothetical protein|nr:hypothetical protein [Thermoplasmata archaeon]
MADLGELMAENNDLLRQILQGLEKIRKEMETMNEMTRKRLPYKWVPGQREKGDRAD